MKNNRTNKAKIEIINAFDEVMRTMNSWNEELYYGFVDEDCIEDNDYTERDLQDIINTIKVYQDNITYALKEEMYFDVDNWMETKEGE